MSITKRNEQMSFMTMKGEKKNTMYTSSKASAQARKTLDYTVMSLAIYYEIRKPLELNI